MDTDTILVISISSITAACFVGCWIGFAVCECKNIEEKERLHKEIVEFLV